MSAQIIPLQAPPGCGRDAAVTTYPFGGCPRCGRNNGYLNDSRDHWFFCDRHKTKWRAGTNLFSSWREEDDEVWRLNRFRLAEYMTVSPVHAGLS